MTLYSYCHHYLTASFHVGVITRNFARAAEFCFGDVVIIGVILSSNAFTGIKTFVIAALAV